MPPIFANVTKPRICIEILWAGTWVKMKIYGQIKGALCNVYAQFGQRLLSVALNKIFLPKIGKKTYGLWEVFSCKP